ncbi:hypothetical protein J2X46_003969 [Nocardioides sp. BE266]|uniref:hypothetical protein n=1 Tax=Nocardioides sp. BE266 TaxID=2817725 RepID=UPI002865BEB9|nr:hypothetical protein [Nocardioides sp. BE266]MDR7254967.1 hypothetical protein [Nocardioides sp. BE266]
MSDLRTGLLLLSNMKTPVMLTAPGNPATSPERALVGRLHEMAVTRCPTPRQMEWRRTSVTGYASDPRPVFGRIRHGKGALVKRQVLAEAMRSRPQAAGRPSRECGVLDELTGCEPLNLCGPVRVLDPCAITPGPDDKVGEW